MPTLTEGKRDFEFLLTEEGSISREQVTIAAAAGLLAPGTVVGKITASGKYIAYSNAAVDGSEVAAGIVCYGVPDLAVDQKAVIIARLAEVKADELTGLDTPARADFLALKIICR